MSDLEKRRKRAVEYILENEALTSDLDNAAALKLNEWGIRLAAFLADDSPAIARRSGRFSLRRSELDWFRRASSSLQVSVSSLHYF